jgi:D-3-phosphoglycerate dehydrogenase
MTVPATSPLHRIVRLNAETTPIREYEASLYRQLGVTPLAVEAKTPQEILAATESCDALLVVSNYLPAAVIDHLPRCRVISRMGIGTDRIDVEAATRAGIVVTNVPGFCSAEMGDHAMALLLALARQLPRMTAAFAAGAWRRAFSFSERNHRLSAQVLGLVGCGDSAKALARRAQGFGLRIIATRRRVAAALDPELERLGITLVDLETLLRESDYVSLHLPLSAATHHLIDEGRFNQMKPGSYLINTSRGALIDEPALIKALRSGHLGGAGLDTFEHVDVFSPQELGPPQTELLAFDQVILTPHVAANSVEGSIEVVAGGVGSLAAILEGRWPPAHRIVNRGVVPRCPLQQAEPAARSASVIPS